MSSNIDNGIIITGGVRCEACGATITFNLPLATEIVAECMRHFSALHQFCNADGWPVFKPATIHIVVGYDKEDRASVLAVEANQYEAEKTAWHRAQWAPEIVHHVDIEEWTIGDEAEVQP